MDEQEGQSASLLVENQNCSVKPIIASEGECSAAPAVPPLQTFTNTEILNILDAANQGVCPSKDAITVLMETRHARSLMGAINNNPQWGINLSDYSTVPQNSKLRSQRLSRLKSYTAMGEYPPEEFLLECLSDPCWRFKLNEWHCKILKS